MPQQVSSTSLPFEQFWRWLKLHYNCIVRAGGPGFTLFDQADIHWHLAEEEDGLLVVQLIRGKEMLGEMVLSAADVIYVQSSPQEDEQALFDCIGPTTEGPAPLCYFLMAHDYDEQPDPTPRWTH